MKTKSVYSLSFTIMFVMSMLCINVMAQKDESDKVSPKTLNLRPNSRDQEPTHRDNFNQRMIHKHKQNADINPDNKNIKDKEIKPNKKAIQNRKLNRNKARAIRRRVTR